jgi:hypothetical protein
VAIEPVESIMTATFQGFVAPCIDAVAVAFTESVFTPNRAMKVVFTVVLLVTTTAFATEVELHVVPFGMSELIHRVFTDVLTVPRPELALAPPLEALNWFAIDVEFTDADCESYTNPEAASAAALAEF